MVLDHLVYAPSSWTAFNPSRFISTFESTVGELLALRKDIQRKTEAMEQSTKLAEQQYSRKMTELNGGFDVRL